MHAQGINMWPYLVGAVDQTPRSELLLDWWSNETVYADNERQPTATMLCASDFALML